MFQDSISDCSNHRICHLLLCIFPILSRFPNPRHCHHIGSSADLGVPCLRLSISDCHMRSFSHLGVTYLSPSIPITHPDFLSLPVAVLLYDHLPTTPPPPSFRFPRVFQGGPKLFFCRLLAPTCPLLRILSPLHTPQCSQGSM